MKILKDGFRIDLYLIPNWIVILGSEVSVRCEWKMTKEETIEDLKLSIWQRRSYLRINKDIELKLIKLIDDIWNEMEIKRLHGT